MRSRLRCREYPWTSIIFLLAIRFHWCAPTPQLPERHATPTATLSATTRGESPSYAKFPAAVSHSRPRRHDRPATRHRQRPFAHCTEAQALSKQIYGCAAGPRSDQRQSRITLLAWNPLGADAAIAFLNNYSDGSTAGRSISQSRVAPGTRRFSANSRREPSAFSRIRGGPRDPNVSRRHAPGAFSSRV